MKFSTKKCSAFSLVELSIVLVILGLLVGGVLSGQSLIRAAELRSIPTDLARYATAAQTFRDKYFAIPGDMNNATSFWGTDNVSCPNGGGSSGTCNGNGDGAIWNGAVGNTCENQEFWRQLSLAGLIEGKFTPQTPASCFLAFTPGRDAPRLRISNGAVTISNVGNITSNAAFPGNAIWIGNYQNVFFVGLNNGSSINGMAGGSGASNNIFKPEELWNIDTKMDDGKPAIGSVISIYPGSYIPAASATTGCTTTNVASTAEYSLANSAKACGMAMKSGF